MTTRLSMRIVKNGDLHVSAPFGTSKADILHFVESNQSWIVKAMKSKKEREQRQADFYSRLPLSKKEQRQQAVNSLNAIITPMIDRYAPAMNVAPNNITYKATKYRWGVCNVRTRDVCFSIYLLLLPEKCIEHVVVHELAHLIVPNHSRRFYEVMDVFFPKWREIRKETRRIFTMPND